MLGLLKSTVVLCLFLAIDQTNALSCYSCYGCKTYTSPNSTKQVCGASAETVSDLSNGTNLTTVIPTTTAALVWQCSKTGITIAGQPSWTYGCDSDCVESNTGGLFSFVINAGTYCCTTSFCNFSVSLMKSGLSSTLLSLALIFLLAVLNY